MLSFEDYSLLESEIYHLGIVSHNYHVFEGVLNIAKKQKLIDKLGAIDYAIKNRPVWQQRYTSIFDSFENKSRIKTQLGKCYLAGYTQFRVIKTNDGKFVEAVNVEDSPQEKDIKDKTSFKIAIFSTKPIDPSNTYLPESFDAHYKKIKYSFSLSVFEDSSNKRVKIEIKDVHPMQSKELYFMIYSYDINKAKSGDELSVESIMNTDEYKNLINDTPLRLTSTSKQLKNTTFVFSIPPDLIASLYTSNIGANKYYSEHGMTNIYTIYLLGKVIHAGVTNPIKIFDSTTIEGWKLALTVVKDHCLKTVMPRYKDIIFLTTDELRTKYRGTIKAKNYGI